MSGILSEGLLAALPFGVAILDADGRVLSSNAQAGRLLRPTVGGLDGKPLFWQCGDLPGMDEAERTFRKGMREAGVDLRFTTEAHDPGFGPVPIRVHVRSFRDGTTLRAVVVIREEASREDQDALDRAGEITSSVKHDVNNLLMGLAGYASLLRERPDLPEAARSKVELVEGQARKIRDRIADLDAVKRLAGGRDGLQG